MSVLPMPGAPTYQYKKNNGNKTKPTLFTDNRRELILAALAKGHNHKHACALAKVLPDTVTKWLRFGKMERDVYERECEMWQEGDPMPELSEHAAFHMGYEWALAHHIDEMYTKAYEAFAKQPMAVTLLIFLKKCLQPEDFTEGTRLEVTGKVQHKHTGQIILANGEDFLNRELAIEKAQAQIEAKQDDVIDAEFSPEKSYNIVRDGA